jgi:hypothetical protein
MNRSTDDYAPQKTVAGCPSCGYPLRPTDARCPQCDAPALSKATKKTAQDTVKTNSGLTPAPGGYTGRTVMIGNDKVEDRKLAGLLISYSRKPQGESFPVFEGRNTVGRNADISPDDHQISEKHFSILYRREEKKFKFKDELSTNGTFVNDVLTDEGELKNFDVISIGSTRLLFIAIPEF